MSKNWEVKNLGSLCEVITKGTTPTSVGHNFIDEGINFVKVESISLNGEFKKNKFAYISKEANNSLKRSQLKEGDILFSIAGALGRTAIVTEDILPANTNQALSIIRLKEDKNILKEYLFLTLKSGFTLEQVEKFKGGVAQQNLSLTQMKDFQIPIPSVKTQKQIVEILDTAFEALEKAKINLEKNLANTKELFDSKLNEIFSQKGEGWEEKTLAEVCTKITDGTHQTPTYFDSGYIFLSSRNVTTGIINWDKIKYIDEPQHIQMQKRVSPQLNDILLAKNGTTGVAAIVDKDVDFDIYVSLALLRASDDIEPMYLLYFVNSPIAKKQFNKRLKGIGVPNLHLKEIREVSINYPISKNEQQEVISYIKILLNKKQQLEQKYQQKLDNLEELKKSLLQKAFNGELTK